MREVLAPASQARNPGFEAQVAKVDHRSVLWMAGVATKNLKKLDPFDSDVLEDARATMLSVVLDKALDIHFVVEQSDVTTANGRAERFARRVRSTVEGMPYGDQIKFGTVGAAGPGTVSADVHLEPTAVSALTALVSAAIDAKIAERTRIREEPPPPAPAYPEPATLPPPPPPVDNGAAERARQEAAAREAAQQAAARDAEQKDRVKHADARTDQGMEYLQQQLYDQALVEFQAAYKLSPVPGLLFDIAVAYYNKHDRANALAYFQKYADADPDGPKVKEAHKRIAELTRELSGNSR
jgi:hypothetical protein